MKSLKIIMIALLLSVLLTSGFYQDALAKQSSITLVNRTDEKVTFKLSGDKVYEFTVKPGKKVTEKIDHDTYQITYTACGIDYDWELEFEKSRKIVLYPCKHQPTKMQVKSHLGDDVELIIEGYEDFEYDIEPGKNRIELFSGINYYEYEACGGQVFSSEIRVRKSGTTQLILHSCEWFTHPARIYGHPNPVKFRIVNHASFPLIMTLIGPENYLVTANPGVNVFTLVSGSYKYSYYQDYKLISGSMVVTKNGIGVLVVTPNYVYDFVDDTDDLE
jgi:hypothetical protein